MKNKYRKTNGFPNKVGHRASLLARCIAGLLLWCTLLVPVAHLSHAGNTIPAVSGAIESKPPTVVAPSRTEASLPKLSDAELKLARKAYQLFDTDLKAMRELLPKLNPDHAATADLVATDYYMQQKYELVIRTLEKHMPLYRKTCPLIPQKKEPCEILDDGYLCANLFGLNGEANFWLKRYQQAVDDLTDYIKYRDNVCQHEMEPSKMRSLGASYYYLKRYPEALEAMMRGYVLLTPGIARAEFAWNIAVVHAVMRHTDEALKWLNEPLTSDDREHYYGQLKTDHDFDYMRNDKRFTALLDR